jgi:putative membrane protein
MHKSIVFLGSLVLILSMASYAVSQEKSEDQRFVNEAARGGMLEIELGKIAQKNGASSAVKQFGEQMVTDHARLNNELGAAAKKDGLQVPAELSPKQSAVVRSFSRLPGKEFDSKYAQLMVKAHTDDLAAFQKAESSTEKPNLKKAIADAIPVVQHHLEMAKQL